ncbi:MAG: protease complex subunit PrcB family protein [Lachnospiraceae bacterium]|nr:protease complex subunit PrcB family protein [Lachnospiraceae bacterium]
MKQFIMVLCFVGLIVVLGGCMEKERQQKRENVDFTVCTEAQLPDEIKAMIQKKKERPFQFTYSLQKYSYIVIGYGEQNGGGYSIKVEECTEDQNRIYVDTTLLGSEESQEEVKSYPYIALKCLKSGKKVVFL